MKAQRFQAIPDGAGYISESDDGLDFPQFHSEPVTDDCEGPSPTPFPTMITGILFGLAIEIILIVLTSI
ncbi:hypothetical protein [Faecalibaculum rodentium]|uniref:hypothetical protein n=1 Tax=Faecalibaculum rodentium TaxID=1702221 RepID=UPI0023F48CAC|nr:hypothetical protein [Faecalibaculum rodentium]